MKNLFNPKLTLIICIIILMSLSSCAKADYCENLKLSIQDPSKINLLTAWVDNNFPTQNVNTDTYILGGGMWPGIFWYPVKFDWLGIDFNKESQIRIVGKLQGDEILISSLFFGERTRQGILIKHAKSQSFGVSEEHIISKNGRIAAVCRKDTQ